VLICVGGLLPGERAVDPVVSIVSHGCVERIVARKDCMFVWGNRAADVWSLCLWPAAENHVAGEQAFVLPTFAVGLNRVLRCRAGGFFHARRLRKGRLGWLRLQRLPRPHRTKTFLIVTQPVRVRSNGRRLRLSWTPRRLGLTSDQDDHQNSERQARHQPRLESARQYTARDRPVVADWRSG
jgi:hypothetical protein